MHTPHLIILLGKTTLESAITRREIEWALQYERKIIPIWHNSFEYRTDEWDVSPAVHEAISSTNAIRVTEESALGYFTAITQLLNRFGITPE